MKSTEENNLNGIWGKFKMENKFQITTKEDLEFLASWLRAAFELNPNLRGNINSISIKFCNKFIGIDQSGTISIEKVERDSK